MGIATVGLSKPIVALKKVAGIVAATAAKLAKKGNTLVVSQAVLKAGSEGCIAATKFTHSPKAIRAYASYNQNAFCKMPAKLQPKQIKGGTNGRIALIGRSMGNKQGLISVLDAKEAKRSTWSY